MTERPSGRWLVKSGAADLLIRTGSGTDNAVFEIEVGGGNAVRTLTATVLSCSEDTCVVSIEGQSTVVRLTPHDHDWYAMAGGESFTVTALAESSTDSRGADESDAGDTSPAADPDALCAPMPAATRPSSTSNTPPSAPSWCSRARSWMPATHSCDSRR